MTGESRLCSERYVVVRSRGVVGGASNARSAVVVELERLRNRVIRLDRMNHALTIHRVISPLCGLVSN